MVSNKTRLNMVIGFPLTHTLSPVLHGTVYESLNCDAVMLAHSGQDLDPIIQALKTFRVGLTAVTMPFKQSIFPYLDIVSEAAKEVKAVNTIIQHDNILYGYNTDIEGIAYALRAVPLANKNVLIIGAGGAAIAAAYYLKKNNANLFWLNRTAERVIPLIENFGGRRVENLEHCNIDIILNSTPLGMYPNFDNSPLPGYSFNTNQVVFDMVYNPVETRLLKDARSLGATCISGLDMFIAQGLKQDELWLEQSIYSEGLFGLIETRLQSALRP